MLPDYSALDPKLDSLPENEATALQAQRLIGQRG